MCKEKEKETQCEFTRDAKECALKHMAKARKLISDGKYEDADTMLSYAEDHLKEM